MTPLERHEARLREIGCVVCRREGRGFVPAALHHIAEGSGLRSDWAQVPLCQTHHQGAQGLHNSGLGLKRFLSIYRPPGESEWGLLAWAMEDLAKFST